MVTQPQTMPIRFDNGRTAQAVIAPPQASAEDVLTRLAIRRPRAVLLVFGDDTPINPTLAPRLADLFSRGIAAAAADAEAAILDGGTQAGVMELMGQGVAHHGYRSPLIGVAPRDLVTYPGDPEAGNKPGAALLDPNHTHFALIQCASPDCEAPALLGLAKTLSKGKPKEAPKDAPGVKPKKAPKDIPVVKPVVAILAGGGDAAKAGLLHCVRNHWQIVIVEGSGGVADQLAALVWRAQAAAQPNLSGAQPAPPNPGPADAALEEIAEDGKIDILPAAASAATLRRWLNDGLGKPDSRGVLRMAWKQFADYDLNAVQQQKTFWRLQKWILTLGVVVSFLAVLRASLQMSASDQVAGIIYWLSSQSVLTLPAALIQSWLDGLAFVLRVLGVNVTSMALVLEWLRWLVVALTAAIGALIAYTNRFDAGDKWVLLRNSAEIVKREIYRYRVRAGIYSRRSIHDKRTSRDEVLAEQIHQIGNRMMRTGVNTAGLARYNEDDTHPIPPEMYGAAGEDDGYNDLTAQRYMDICVGDQINYYQKKCVMLDRRWKQWQILMYVLIAVGTFLAALGADLWVPVTAAAVTAITAFARTRQYDNTLMKYNQAETDLNNLQAWWKSLAPQAQRSQENIDRLVQLTEQVLESENSGWVQRMQDALVELRREQQPNEPKETKGADSSQTTEQQPQQPSAPAPQPAPKPDTPAADDPPPSP